MILFTGFLSCKNNTEIKQDSHAAQMFVKAVPFKTADGWGYEIYADNKLYIRQALIPGLSGNRSFINKEDALKVGELVIHKMDVTHKIPFVSQTDLQQLHIQIPD